MVEHAEEELRGALLIHVVGRDVSSCAAEVSDALASRFHLEADALDLRRAAPSTFIAFLPSEELASRVYNEGRPFSAPPLRLLIQRWSRHSMATGGDTLLSQVEIELRGIPAHLWRIEMAEHLLNEFCLIERLHQNTADNVKFFSFQLTAWCTRPESLPASLDLHVVEPITEVGEELIRTLVYPITVSVIRCGNSSVGLPPPPPPPDNPDGDREHDRSKRRRRHLPPPSCSARGLVHELLGSRGRVDLAAGGAIDAPVSLGVSVPAAAPIPQVPSVLALAAHAQPPAPACADPAPAPVCIVPTPALACAVPPSKLIARASSGTVPPAAMKTIAPILSTAPFTEDGVTTPLGSFRRRLAE
jgi:hypothetical protein